MCRRWLLLLMPLLIHAGTSALDEVTAASISKMEETNLGEPNNSNGHQLYKRRFTGYKDFNKYKFAKSKGRFNSFFLRNPYNTVVRPKRSNSGMLRLLNKLYVNHPVESTETKQIRVPVSVKNNQSRTQNAEYAASKEENAFNIEIFKRIDKTLTQLNNKLEAMDKEKLNAFIMFKVPVPRVGNDIKSRAKREANETNEDSDITVIGKTIANNKQTTIEPNTVSKIEEKIEDTPNNTIVLVITHNVTNKNDSANLMDPPLDTNKTETINNKDIDNQTLSSAELRDQTRKFYKTNYQDYILKMEEILHVIHRNLSPLKIIKEKHSKDEEYKLGYIIANLESAEETIERLISKLKTRELTTDQTQNILDKVTISSMVVTNLMNYLGRYSILPAKSGIIVE